MLEIVKRRYLYFAISLVVIVPGLIALIIWGLPMGIDFTGGSLMEVTFEDHARPSTEEVVNLYNDFGFTDAKAQNAGETNMIVRTRHMEEDEQAQMLAEMNSHFEGDVTLQRFESVGPSVGKETAKQAAGAVGLAAVAIMLYITYAFRQVSHAFRYGVAAILAMLHDVLVVVGIEAILGHFLGWETDSLFLTALLTVIGFSVHDTVVVFDRIRENARIHRRLPYETMVNHSIVQTLDRSINTQLTVMFTLFALVLFGGTTIRHFVTILLIGVFSGTYSSIFNAAPVLVVWENKEWRNWFGRKAKSAA
ncbi:MAG: protein translocase subunit SecF [Anaerolineaceae bacterium 4572_5.1]|nr:MAG: protein translocase subunit SecF [Anaerolineaceae bacterium 4572_5.1]RLD03734.1 MAG: protein translocase subunit SecF [Chloroflexota bacterium]